jgi:hypothetical protein
MEELVTMDQKTARAHAAALGVAFDRYLAALAGLNSIEPCSAPWPPSLADVAPARCQLLAGHTHRDGTRHRHRVTGSQAIVEWD